MTERVDLEELRELMTDARNYDVDTMYGAKVHKEFGDAIEALIAELTELRAQAGGGVACSEQMPTPSAVVLIPGGCAYYEQGKWRTMMGISAHNEIGWAVTHWMPLPKPPEATDG